MQDSDARPAAFNQSVGTGKRYFACASHLHLWKFDFNTTHTKKQAYEKIMLALNLHWVIKKIHISFCGLIFIHLWNTI